MKKAKKERKYTLSGQMTAIFIGLLVFILMTVFIVNTGFLGRYYMSHKQKDLIEMYEAMSEAVNNGNLGNEAVQKKLVAELEKTNIDVCAMDISDDGKVVFTNVKEEGFLYKQMLRIFFLKDDDQERILKHTNDYVVRKIKDPQSGIDYLEMWGYLSDNVFVTMRSPLDSIRESANLANQFLIYLGIFGLFFGGILVWIFSRKITKPVLELARLSEDMANLNFDAKYTSGGKNEIGVLGENFNKMSEQLEKTISELKTANNQLQHDIEQKEKLEDMRNEFLGNVSHELKTPITSIRVLADSLMGMEEVPVELYREFMSDISDEIDRESKIIDDLLSLVKMDKSEAELNITQVNLNTLVEQILKRLKPIANRRKVELIFESIREVTADVDEMKLSLAITNLVENAIKYNMEEGWVRVTLDADHKFFYLKVQDSGIGIPEDVQDRIFERFYRVDKGRSRKLGGTGLGLAIVKNAVIIHGGNISAKSSQSGGLEFVFTLGKEK